MSTFRGAVGGEGEDPFTRAAVQDAVGPPLAAVIDADALVERADPDASGGVHGNRIDVLGVRTVLAGELFPCVRLCGIGREVKPPQALILGPDPEGVIGGAEGGDELAGAVENGPRFGGTFRWRCRRVSHRNRNEYQRQ